METIKFDWMETIKFDWMELAILRSLVEKEYNKSSNNDDKLYLDILYGLIDKLPDTYSMNIG